MIKLNVTVHFDAAAVANKIDRALDKAQHALDQQVLKDSNYFIPFDTGELMRSSLRASQIGQGLIVWDTPYARRLYYNPQYNFRKDKNPNAQGLWFEAAKTQHYQEWVELAQKAFDENLK
ncbi:minor capsid protein [Geobacillus stearothermophilus]|nr:minor capsid protein [Geobacillus stearothermophilus]